MPKSDRSCRPVSVFAIALWCLALWSAGALAADDYSLETHMVPMSDGVRLATDVCIPTEGTAPFPVIFSRGPYGKSGIRDALAISACGRGYVLVAQDIRGCFDSEGGDVVVFQDDGWSKRRDGHESIEWISAQPWCDGKVASWGGSALGITQNMLAPHAPLSLKAQFIVTGMSDMYRQMAYQGGAWRTELIGRWIEAQKFDPASLATFRAHPHYDEFWAEMSPESQAAAVHAPGVHIGGWYDIFLQGTLDSFVSIHNRGGEPARGNCRLIMAPFAHGAFEELVYPPSARELPASDPLRYFDHWLKGLDNGVAEEAAVHYYVMGDPTDPAAPGNFWRSADNWPPPSRELKLFLRADATLERDPPAGEPADLAYNYDPKNPVPTVGGQNLTIARGPADQRSVESRSDVLVFTTAVLEEPLEVTGHIFAKLFAASDCPDTDFTVKLTDVYPDGRSMLVTDGLLRARYRDSFSQPKPLEPGRVYEFTVDLWSTSLVFNKGHRIRVAVSSSNSPRYEPNPNTGDPLYDAETARVATNTLRISAEHPSQILLPIYAGEPDRGEAED